MTQPNRQLVLDLPLRPALGGEDFIVSACNKDAVSHIDRWPDWVSYGLVLTGPAGSGKTHLAHVWRHMSGASIEFASGFGEEAVRSRGVPVPAVIEDIDRGVGDEKALFHLLNMAREQRFHVLVTARSQPGEWSLTLPDLRSRLRALPVTTIGPPDDSLIRAVLVKLIGDRQLPATPHAIDHLARHMERSMAAAIAVVEELDRLVWDNPREISRETARLALAALAGREAEQEE